MHVVILMPLVSYIILLVDGKQSCSRQVSGDLGSLGRVSPSDRSDPWRAMPREPI